MEVITFFADTAAVTHDLGNLIGVGLILLGLELVLGIDNILVISIMVSRLPKEKQDFARYLGLAMALFARIGLLFGVTWLMGLNAPISDDIPWLASQSWLSFVAKMSIKDLILLAGGLFLLYKAVKEIHHVVEFHEHGSTPGKAYDALGAAVVQIVMLDIVFSLDSVITAVGMTDHLPTIIIAVVLAFTIVLIFAKPIGDFILAHPALKILALSFLVTIGITIIMEAFHKELPKAYIYLPMGFALVVEILQMRYSKNQRKTETVHPDGHSN